MRRALGRLVLGAALSATAASPLAGQSTVWTSGTYTYDGAGNVTAMGADSYTYDTLGRVSSGTADQQRTGGSNSQSYTYDSFGNRKTVTTSGTGCVWACGGSLSFDGNNHISGSGATYDAAGNLTAFSASGTTFTYAYDGTGMLTEQSVAGGIDWRYVYTAEDERIGTYTGGGNWRFTIRDVDGKVLREVTAWQNGGTTTWVRDRDHVYRDSQLLATVEAGGSTEQFHPDHLGTPRVVTSGSGTVIGIHAYYPFGDELALNLSESPLETHKFTGHERDVNSGSGNSLDYMHARYYAAFQGRFLSVDPKGRYKPTAMPQEWNRYAYALNNPVKIVDPNGRENTIYFVNTLPKTWWTPNVAAMLAPRVVGTPYQGRVQVVGPGASAGMLRATITRADSTDIVIIASHAGQSQDDARGGNLQMRGPNGQLQTVSGAQLASWANDGSAPKAVIIAGCCSNQVADTVHNATGADALGTDKRTINTENQPGAIVAAGAIAQGMDANTAANMATQQLKTDAGCGNNPKCDPDATVRYQASPP